MQSYAIRSARHSPSGERDESDICGFAIAMIVGTIVGIAAGVLLKKIVGVWVGVF
jgi:hypothetical protein